MSSRVRSLLVRPGAFGDVLLATPVVRKICAQHPEVRHDFFSEFPNALRGITGIGRRVPIWRLPLGGIRRKYDSAHFFCYEHAPRLHAIDGYAASTGVIPEERTLSYRATERERRKAAKLIGTGFGTTKLVGVQFNCGDVLRSYPRELAQKLIDKIAAELPDATVIAIGAERCELSNCTNLCGRIRGIEQAAAVVSLLDYFVTIDSGFFHVAQAVGVPTVAIFGCTLPELRATRVDILQVARNETLDCLGCYHGIDPYAVRLDSCRRGDVACMRQLPVEVIWRKLRDLLDKRVDVSLSERVSNYEETRRAYFEEIYSPELRASITSRFEQYVVDYHARVRKQRTFTNRAKNFVRRRILSIPSWLTGKRRNRCP
jgi:ADP-heptose:LPS heptosyltransferase